MGLEVRSRLPGEIQPVTGGKWAGKKSEICKNGVFYWERKRR